MESIKELSFPEQINDLYKLHYMAKHYNHMVEYQKDTWKLFEPSKFIYAFFAFNSFYSFDWVKSLKENTLISYIEEDADGEKITEPKKFKAMIDFIFTYIKNEDVVKFINYIRNDHDNQYLSEVIEQIVPDKRTEKKTKQFKKRFNKLFTDNDLTIGQLKELIYFVYLVRNNIFHGTKNIIDMSERQQRERLNIYSDILIGTNELLFRVLERETSFIPDKRYTLRI